VATPPLPGRDVLGHALKEKTTNDFCVGTVWGAAGANRYLLRRFRDRVGLPDTIVAVQNLANWVESMFPGCRTSIKVENAANGPEVVAKLRDRLTGISTWNADRDKSPVRTRSRRSCRPGRCTRRAAASPDGTGPDPSSRRRG
jgi:phage terminase large subunit-like protein